MNIFVILSGGNSSRLGGLIPKQYIKVKEKMIIEHSIERACETECVDAFYIVAAKEWQDEIRKVIPKTNKFKGFCNPGANRQLSILSALESIDERQKQKEIYVMIHDAARPKITSKQIRECFEGVVGHDGLMPVLPMKDTVYLSQDGKTITSMLNRSQVVAGQAPEVFEFTKYLKANRALLPDAIKKINGSSEPAIMAQMDLVIIPGDERNYKITTSDDLDRFITDET